jgi:hypothetical protein
MVQMMRQATESRAPLGPHSGREPIYARADLPERIFGGNKENATWLGLPDQTKDERKNSAISGSE